jgi:hypothetical protein
MQYVRPPELPLHSDTLPSLGSRMPHWLPPTRMHTNNSGQHKSESQRGVSLTGGWQAVLQVLQGLLQWDARQRLTASQAKQELQQSIHSL